MALTAISSLIGDQSNNRAAHVVPDLGDSARWGAIADDWPITLHERRAFRVRGFTWFRSNVDVNTSLILDFKRRMEEEIKSRPNLILGSWKWTDNFSVAQLFAAANLKALRFDKAAKSLLLCELAAANRGIQASAFYTHMWIEPAVFTLSNYNGEYLTTADAMRPNLIAHLGDYLGQPQRVFQRMLAGETVSYRLAYSLWKLLLEIVPQHPPGQVIIGTRPENRVTCPYEIIDGPSDPEALVRPTEPWPWDDKPPERPIPPTPRPPRT